MATSLLQHAPLDRPAIPALPGSASPTSLSDAMTHERSLIEQLIAVLVRQRGAVAADRLADVDDSVFATHRLLATLAEARTRRLALLSHLCQRTEPSIHELETLLGPAVTPALVAARDALREAARRLSGEVAINKSVLKHAMVTGEHLLRTLTGRADLPVPPGPLAYGGRGEASHGTTTAPVGARLVNVRA